MATQAAKFDRWAARYDNGVLQPVLHHAVHELVLERICATPPRSLLDLGCGTGHLLRLAAERLPQTVLLGVDVSRSMLEQATAASPHAGFLLAAAEHLPICTSNIDTVVTTFSYRHWSDQSAAISEIGRVLRPGGLLIMAALLPPPAHPFLGWRGRLPSGLRRALAAAGLGGIEAKVVPDLPPVMTVTLVVARRRRPPAAFRDRAKDVGRTARTRSHPQTHRAAKS